MVDVGVEAIFVVVTMTDVVVMTIVGATIAVLLEMTTGLLVMITVLLETIIALLEMITVLLGTIIAHLEMIIEPLVMITALLGTITDLLEKTLEAPETTGRETIVLVGEGTNHVLPVMIFVGEVVTVGRSRAEGEGEVGELVPLIEMLDVIDLSETVLHPPTLAMGKTMSTETSEFSSQPNFKLKPFCSS